MLQVTGLRFYQHLSINSFHITVYLFESVETRLEHNAKITLNRNEGCHFESVNVETAEGKTEGIIILQLVISLEIECHHFDLRKHRFILSIRARISILLLSFQL